MNTEQLNSIFTAGLVYGGVILIAFWIGMIVWTFRDMRARSRDRLSQIAVAALVAFLTLPGLVLYLFLRPRETLGEAYERSLEEEALLQDIEEKPVCPGCKQRIQENWQACPHCHTRLKKPCGRCGNMLELSWDLCPHCMTPAAVPSMDRASSSYSSHARPATADAYVAATPTLESQSREGRKSRRKTESLEFVDGEEV
jgi:hypothetical protein